MRPVIWSRLGAFNGLRFLPISRAERVLIAVLEQGLVHGSGIAWKYLSATEFGMAEILAQDTMQKFLLFLCRYVPKYQSRCGLEE